MNDKDKEAYEKYLIENNVNQRQIWNELSLDEIWQAACDYKQKEIDELEKEKDYLCQKMENMRSIYKDSEKLQAENAKKFSAEEVLLAKLTIENAELKKFISALGYDDQVVDDVIKSLEKLEKLEYE